jgi:ribonuclease HII
MEVFKHNKLDIGIDEAGRGPFCGPVYAGAVIWNNTIEPINLINDSKKLSKKKRKIALEWINDNIILKGTGSCSETEIDKIGIFNATKLAMERAVNSMIVKNSEFFNSNKENIFNVTIDGIGWDKMDFNFSNQMKSKIIPIVKGDAAFCNIAAASILAKEHHDDAIEDYCKINPIIAEKYDLLNNKGYGTKKHREGIIKHGLSDYHRKSYKINYT